MPSADTLLAVEALNVRFGGIAALADVSFDVARGTIHGLIGPNGAGKTTCFNCITRLYQPASGSIVFCGDDLLRHAAHEVAGFGIVRTFQNVALFGRMSVLDNVLVGTTARRLPEEKARTVAREALAYLGLTSQEHRPAGELPYPMRKTVELARALVSEPKLLLLDEPASGLDRGEVAALGGLIARIRKDFGTTILMVEHDMRLVMAICDRIVVLDSGHKLAEGSPEAIRNDRAVTDAYLGVA